MNYPTKIQAIRRKKTVSQCYVNLPLPLAAAIDIHPVKWWSGKLILVTNSGSSANGPTRKKEKNPKGFFSRIHIQVCEISIYPAGRWGDRQSVKRTLDPSPTSVQNTGVDHRGTDIIVSKILDRCYVIHVFDQMRCKRVVKRMWSGRRRPGKSC